MKVSDFMTTRIESIDAGKSVYDAIERMVDRRIRSLLVRFSDRSADQGVITARDVVFRVIAAGRDPRAVTVAEIASRPIVCVSKDVSQQDAAVLMETNKIARVFVCEGERIIGVMSLLDTMAAALITRAREG